MKFSFTEEQDEFRGVLRRFLEARSPAVEVRRLMETEAGYDADVWRQLSQDLGVAALHIPEAYGGAGFGVTELAIATEEAGRALLCAPLFGSIVMASTAILQAGDDAQKRALLPGLAAGERIAALAAAEPGRGWLADDIAMEARADGDGYRLTGVKSYVLDGMAADLLVVAARLPTTGVALFTVDPTADGVSRRALKSMDPTRKLAQVDFADAPATLLGEAGAGDGAYARTLDTALIALAGEMAGGAERLREDALEYVAMRMQFGRSIASFQVTKHKAADMLLEVELAKSAAYSAATAFDDGDAGAPATAALAKALGADVYMQTAIHAVQMHGGIGFTADNDTQLWFKRAKSSEAFLGHADVLRDRMLTHWSDEI